MTESHYTKHTRLVIELEIILSNMQIVSRVKWFECICNTTHRWIELPLHWQNAKANFRGLVKPEALVILLCVINRNCEDLNSTALVLIVWASSLPCGGQSMTGGYILMRVGTAHFHTQAISFGAGQWLFTDEGSVSFKYNKKKKEKGQGSRISWKGLFPVVKPLKVISISDGQE